MSDVDGMLDGTPGLVGEGGARLSNPEAELALLGALLATPDAFGAIEDHVFEEDFSDALGRRIFARLKEAHREGYAIGIKSLTEALGGDPDAKIVGDMTVTQFLARLVADADTSADIEALATEIHDCADRRAAETQDDIDRFEAGFTSTMGLKMWVDQNDPGPEYEYLVEDLIPEAECVILMGETQAGKSFLTFHMGMCGARGQPFFGRKVLAPFGVVWCAYEAERGATARMRAYRRYHNLPLEDLPFAALTRPLKLWPDPEDKHVNALIAEINGIARSRFGGVRLGMVVIDTHNAGTPGASEIDSEVISRIRDRYRRIITETGATLVIVGHTNSQGKHRGNEQLQNNVDTIIKVSFKTRMVGRDAIPVKDDDNRPIRTMRVQKQREGRSGDEHDFVLKEVEDGTKNKFGKARTSCVIAAPNLADAGDDDQPKSRFDGAQFGSGVKVSKGEAFFLQCLFEALADAGVAPPPELALPTSVSRVVEYDRVKILMSQRMLRDDDDTPEGKRRHRDRVKAANMRARQGLMRVQVVGCHDPFIWWTGKAVRGVAATHPRQETMFDAEPISSGPGDDPLGDFIA